MRVADDEITGLQSLASDFTAYAVPWIPGPLEIEAGATAPLYLEPARLTTTQLGTDVTFSVAEPFTLNHDWPGIVALIEGDAQGVIGEEVLLLLRPTDVFDPATQSDFPPLPGRAVAPIEPTAANMADWFDDAEAVQATATETEVGGLPAVRYDVTVDRDMGPTWFCDSPGVGCVDWVWTRSCLCGNIAFKSNQLTRVWVIPLQGQTPLVFFASAAIDEFDAQMEWVQPIIDSIEIGDPEPPVDDPARAIAPFEALPPGTYQFPGLDDRELRLSQTLDVYQQDGRVSFEFPDQSTQGSFGLSRISTVDQAISPTTIDEFLAALRDLDADAVIEELPEVVMLGATARVFNVDLGGNTHGEPHLTTAPVPNDTGARSAVGIWFEEPVRVWLIEHDNQVWMVHADAPIDDPESADANRQGAIDLFTTFALS